ncbi:MAG TPA: DUF255 domain-containing protein [Saprospiraceae bacterium]|nr:DUF255 domain-containing protein [Saprospiraceae bacterium]
MKNSILSGLFLSLVLLFASCQNNAHEGQESATEIKWVDWTEAVESARTENKKKIFVDMYTDWCGWCKRMDRSTFAEPEVVQYMNKHFYPVKFDAEQKEEINYNGKDFKFVAAGKRGYHELAGTLLNGRLSYPSFVFLDENEDRIMISPGYKRKDEFLKELQFVVEGAYKSMSLEEYKAQNSDS